MTEVLAQHEYVPGEVAGPRAWKSELKKAGARESVVKAVEAFRERVRDEAKAGLPVGIAYTVANGMENGEEVQRALYVLTVKGGPDKDGKTASVSCEFDAPKDGDALEEVLRSFDQNMGNCKRWLDAPAAKEGER